MKMPKRTKTIKLDGIYEGFEFTVVTSLPMTIFSYLQTSNWNLIQSALLMFLVDWNFVDEEGVPLPQPQELVPALDPLGRSVMVPRLNDQGEAVLDKDGNETQEPFMVPAVSLVSVNLGMLIIQKVTSQTMSLPDPVHYSQHALHLLNLVLRILWVVRRIQSL